MSSSASASASAIAAGSALPPSMAIITVIITIVFTVLNALFLYYVYQLHNQGCKCAMDWRRTFMEFSLAIFLLFNVATILFTPLKMPWWLVVILNCFTIAYVIITRQFVNKMKRDECACATHNVVFQTLDYFNMFQIVLVVVLVCIVVPMGIWVLANKKDVSVPAKRTKK